MADDALAIVAVLPIPAMLIGPDERVASANSEASALFGHDGTGRHYITVIRQPAALDAVEATQRDGAPREGRFLAREGGRESTWRVVARRVDLQRGRCVLLVFQDLSAVEEAGQIRRDFVANVSHELRTPLTTVMGLVETLSGAAREDVAARDRFLPVIAREAGRMSRLVDDLLSLSRVEAEERLRPSGAVDLRALVSSVATSLEPVAARAGTRLELSLPSGAVTVSGDAAQLRQLASNLIENAIKYGGTTGPVRVTLSEIGEQPDIRQPGVRLTVADDGPGIAPHHIPRLTERFYRVDDHRSREVGGTGLGLAIVKHIVGRHRGRLRIASEVGKGSRFTAVLPSR